MIWLLWQFLYLPLLLALLFPAVIKYENGVKWLKWPYYFTAGLDVYLNFTTLAIYTLDWPARGEWTFSTRLKRLQYYPGWKGAVARMCRDYLNFWQKGHV